MYAHRTSCHARGVGTVQTPLRFMHGLLEGQPLVDLLITVRAVFCIQFIHLDTLQLHALFRFHLLAKFLTPCSIAVIVFMQTAYSFLLCGMPEFAEFFLLGIAESSHPLQHLIEIDLMSVKFRTVHADEAGFPSHSHTACAAHACAVHHDSIQRHVCGYLIFLGEQTHEFHHYGRPYGKAFVYFLTFYHLFNAFCHQAFTSIRTVIGHDDHLV